jgi:hypothetical protein
LNAGFDGFVYLNRMEGIPEEEKESAQEYLNVMGRDVMYWARDNVSDEEFAVWHPSASDSWITFLPEQIKSAFDNDGTWDADDPDIRSNPSKPLYEIHMSVRFASGKEYSGLAGIMPQQKREAEATVAKLNAAPWDHGYEISPEDEWYFWTDRVQD